MVQQPKHGWHKVFYNGTTTHDYFSNFFFQLLFP